MKTELEKVLSVSGKPGLFLVLNSGKSAIIAESLLDGKKHPIHTTQRVSSLADISIFTIEEDVPLRDVLTKMKEHYKGESAPENKGDSKLMRKEMIEFLPTYDEDRVYDSDIRKLFLWYNLLQSKGMLEFAPAENEEETEEGATEA